MSTLLFQGPLIAVKNRKYLLQGIIIKVLSQSCKPDVPQIFASTYPLLDWLEKDMD